MCDANFRVDWNRPACCAQEQVFGVPLQQSRKDFGGTNGCFSTLLGLVLQVWDLCLFVFGRGNAMAGAAGETCSDRGPTKMVASTAYEAWCLFTYGQ